MSEREPLLYDVKTFCADARISKSMFYNLAKAGKGPRILKLGDRTLIAAEDAKTWVRSLAEEARAA